MSYRSYTDERSDNFVNNFDKVITSIDKIHEVITFMILFIEVTTSTIYSIEVSIIYHTSSQ